MKEIGKIYKVKGSRNGSKGTHVKILDNTGDYLLCEIVSVGEQSKFTPGEQAKIYRRCICNYA